MGARSGKQYLDSLRRNQPHVYLDGARVEDIPNHPAFVGPIRSIMEQYDLQHAAEFRDICLYESPSSGELVSSSFMVPRSHEDIVKRRRHFKARADHNFGLMGRAPDFMNAMVTGWELGAEKFASFKPEAGERARKYYEYVRENDLFLTHVLVNPQIDRSRTSAEQEDPHLHLSRVGDTEDGIIVRGAKMLATMAPLTEEMLVLPFGGIAPGDDAYGLIFAIPNNAPGLRFICREPINDGRRGHFDHPLSSRFEEMDCVAIFDDVLVPWERLLVDGTEGAGAFINGLVPDPRATLMQTSSRLLASMELFCGVATKLADAIGITPFLHIQENLGEMLVDLEMMRAVYFGSDAMAKEGPDGIWSPYAAGLSGYHLRAGAIHRRYVEIIHVLAGGGFFYAPMGSDFDNPEIRADIDKFVRGRPGVSAEERVRLFKLAWDLTGDGFGQRVRQYAHFFSGDPIRNTAGFYLGYDKAPLWETVERALAGPGAAQKAPEAEPAPRRPGRKREGLSGTYPASSHPAKPRAG
jgi:4-hydroxyphenylacetate 3-monooxygenase oxygenase component